MTKKKARGSGGAGPKPAVTPAASASRRPARAPRAKPLPSTAQAVTGTVRPEDLEVPKDLPPLVFPSAPDREVEEWKVERRRKRIRTEIYGGLALLAVGGVMSLATRQQAFLIIALLAVAALGAYEFLVVSFE